MSTSTASRGHALERYQMPQLLRPINTVSAVDVHDTAGTSLALFTIPVHWGTVEILAMGAHYAAAGGAQTVDGTIMLEIAGADVEDADGDDFVVTCEASHTIWDAVETSLNSTTSATELTQGPSFPTADYNDKIEMKIGTEGTGAGDQTLWPYLIVRIKNP